MSQGQWSEDRQWWWNGREWVPASQAPQEASQPPSGPPGGPPGSPTPPPKRKGRRRLWLILGALLVLILGVCTIAVASNSGNQKKATSTPTPAAQAAATQAPKPASTPNPAGTCTPQPCANDNFGWIVNISNVRYGVQSGNDFEKPEAGNVYVAVDVTFTNKLTSEQHANPLEFVLQDGSGVKHQTTYFSACPVWSAVNVTAGASYGPKCLAFEAAANKPSGLVLVWTPGLGKGDYNIKLT